MFDVAGSHFGVGDNDAAGVLASVKFAAHVRPVLVVVAKISSTITR